MAKQQNVKAQRASRRDVLKLAGASVPVAVAAVAGGTAAAEVAVPGAPEAGLRKSEHVKKYLETARF